MAYYENNDTISDNPIFEISDDVGDFVGLAYNNGTLWITTLKKFRLIKVNWSTKEVQNIYKMRDNGVFDPRGVEIIDNKIHILDGYNSTPYHHVLKNAIHIYSNIE